MESRTLEFEILRVVTRAGSRLWVPITDEEWKMGPLEEIKILKF